MQRLKVYFTYDGTRYHGWQRQKNTPDTIQEVMENKFSMVSNHRVHLTASGRTDAGVHARIQVAHIDIPKTAALRLDVEGRLVSSLNSLLPKDVRIFKIEKVSSQFNALAHVEKKTYVYFVDPSPIQLPSLRAYSWSLSRPLDWKAMHAATKLFQGTHDFKAFCAADSSVKTTTRTIFEAYWGKVPVHGFGYEAEIWALRLTGSGFLKHMVRSIVGTLVKIGNQKARPELVSELLEQKERPKVGATAPPHGLWLWDILY